MSYGAICLTALLFIASSAVYASTPQRIISLSPHATELAFAAGLGDKLIAVSDYSDYPPAAQKLEKIANYKGINVDRIVALQPDLIITWPEGNPVREINKLKQMGFHLYASHVQTLADISKNLIDLSQFATNPSIGQQAAKTFNSQLKALKQRYSHQTPVRYFYQLSQKPIITVAQDNWPSEVFSFCGGKNVFGDSPSPYPQVGIEQVVLAQPDVIFTSEHAMTDGSMWQEWKNEIPAVGHHRVWSLHSDWLNRPTPRTLRAIKEVCQYFAQARENLTRK
ncbi:MULTISPECIES: vitamin B12 ABC transporter substrate-binding protein BtuF [Vibrio]|uniref:Vitamin B12-binding protein n=2 Tax=Vibrio TaxID=662 RepID=A0A7X4RT76_9VIBR|nr:MULTISPECIES: vitamin B12 ABC transporter substrate-binding protein BtuF [Vibrio]MBF9001547.1 vitamin B12 ABC transporter substrate-binding protein BtuF [Vibrio nitrifigilis]MZI91779.1 vitamin B12 ABC transporter substrate-binding protein BtuF [Vibrio eleionomae]